MATLPYSHCKALIVDDQRLAREILSTQLRALGIDVLAVGSGAEALIAAERKTFDVMLLDIMMPDMDGYQLIQNLHGQAAMLGRDLPPALAYSVSVYDQNGQLPELEKQRLHNAGFSGGLGKPAKPSVMIAMLRTLLPPPPPATPKAQRAGTEQPTNTLGAAYALRGTKDITRALVVDDDRLMALTAQARLQQQGITYVEVAHTAAQALAMFKEHPFQLVMLDLEMPEQSGFAIARAMRQLEFGTFHRTLITALSGHVVGPDVIKLCQQAGMDDCLGKPLTAATLAERLKRWQS